MYICTCKRKERGGSGERKINGLKFWGGHLDMMPRQVLALYSKWRKAVWVEAKMFLLEETRFGGNESFKVREGRRANEFIVNEATSWLKGFVDGVVFLVKTQGWRSTMKMEGRLYQVEQRKNLKGWFLMLLEQYGNGRR
uniref:Uncharacterized protein n=1 Tax=Nelumbo nucifera TaxID=4432 RepID=A0A822ZNE3_NELNU|nr:TPA_asm: hypothetical protein HUJ06_017451 [Nelumbo nucifera]